MQILTRLRTVGASIVITTSQVLAASKPAAVRPAAAARYPEVTTYGSQESGSPAPSAKRAPKHAPKHSHAYDFLIRGTVFSENALAFPGVQLRARRAGEKKFRWETYTNSHGEFAIRVPQGQEYELAVRAKGFSDQARTIDARTGDIQDDVVFRMERAGGKK